jgi:DNA-binding transcriptional regulator YiaG
MQTHKTDKDSKLHKETRSTGVLKKELGYLFSNLPLSYERLGDIFHVSSKTVQRWKEGQSTPSSTYALVTLSKLSEIIRFGLKVYTPEGLEEFLTTPLPCFGHRAAIELIAEGRNADVMGALADDYEGLGL